MKPYLAIIKDSFREALASRVLWTLLAIITLLLLALIPLHWVTTIAADMTALDIRNGRNLSEVLIVGANDDATALQKHLWNQLSQRTRTALKEPETRRGPQAEFRERMARDINKSLDKDDFYQADIWGDVQLSKRALEMESTGKLAGDELKQFNRLAWEAALPGQLRPCPDEPVRFKYATWELEMPSLRRQDAVDLIDSSILVFMAIVVGFFGIFSGVLVTAPIVPNMLNSGSLYVLLSKPIARPFLFLAKFLGGCSYVAINATLLIGGIWLLLGFRFGIWKPQLLWSLPLFLFTFAIFYSVSALSGLVWRSAIMAIVATIFFWFVCFVVGKSKGAIEMFVIWPNQIESIEEHAGQTFVARANGSLSMLNQKTNALDDVMASPPRPQRGPELIMGPRSTVESMAYNEATEELFLLERSWSQSNVAVGSLSENFKSRQKLNSSRNTKGLFIYEGQPVCVADGGVFPLKRDKVSTPKKGTSIFGLITIPAPPEEEVPEVKLSGDLGPLPSGVRVAIDNPNNAIYLVGENELRKWSVVDGLFQETAKVTVELPRVTHLLAKQGRVVLATNGSNRRNEDDSETKPMIHVFDDQLASTKEFAVSTENKLKYLRLSQDGNTLACLHEDEQLDVFDLNGITSEDDSPAMSVHNVTGFGFSSDQMLTANATDQITKYSLSNLKKSGSISPELPLMKRIYRLVIRPIYLIFPKPGELQNTMQYLITGKDTVKIQELGPSGRTVKLNPWQPVISNSIFIGVMLLIGCVYVFRQDF